MAFLKLAYNLAEINIAFKIKNPPSRRAVERYHHINFNLHIK